MGLASGVLYKVYSVSPSRDEFSVLCETDQPDVVGQDYMLCYGRFEGDDRWFLNSAEDWWNE